MLVHRFGDEHRFVDHGEVDRLEQALLGKHRGISRVGEDDVGVHRIVLDHRLDFGGIGIGCAGDLDAGLLGEGLEIGSLQRLFEGATWIGDRHALGLGAQHGREAHHRQHHRNAGGTCQETPTVEMLSLFHGFLPWF